VLTDHFQTGPEEVVTVYKHYAAVYTAVAQSGYQAWEEKYLPLLVGELRKEEIASIPSLAEKGYRMVGATVDVTEPMLIEYDTSAPLGDYTAILEVCTDSSDVRWESPAQNTLRPGLEGKHTSTVSLARQVQFQTDGTAKPDPYGQGWWRVAQEKAARTRPC